MDRDTIEAAVHDAGELLRADGADLRLVALDLKAARLQVAVDLSGASCLDCVMPPDLLADMLTVAITREVRGELEIRIDDPRRDATGPR